MVHHQTLSDNLRSCMLKSGYSVVRKKNYRTIMLRKSIVEISEFISYSLPKAQPEANSY